MISEEAGVTDFYVKSSDGWLVITGIKISSDAAFLLLPTLLYLSVIISTRSLLYLLTLTLAWISDSSGVLSREVRGGAAISF